MSRISRKSPLLVALLLIMLAAQAVAIAHVHEDGEHVHQHCELCNSSASLVGAVPQVDLHIFAEVKTAVRADLPEIRVINSPFFAFQQRAPPVILL